jgi:hypothetical protein
MIPVCSTASRVTPKANTTARAWPLLAVFDQGPRASSCAKGEYFQAVIRIVKARTMDDPDSSAGANVPPGRQGTFEIAWRKHGEARIHVVVDAQRKNGQPPAATH